MCETKEDQRPLALAAICPLEFPRNPNEELSSTAMHELSQSMVTAEVHRVYFAEVQLATTQATKKAFADMLRRGLSIANNEVKNALFCFVRILLAEMVH